MNGWTFAGLLALAVVWWLYGIAWPLLERAAAELDEGDEER